MNLKDVKFRTCIVNPKMAKETIKKTISAPQLKNELIKLFESGNTDKGKCREVLGSLYKIQVQRFYKSFNEALLEWQETKQTATNEAIYQNQTDALKSGLKSRIEWVLELQNELKENRVEESYLDIKTGEVIRYFRAMTPTERKGYIERIAKFEGMDAPTKTENKNTHDFAITEIIID